jgi:hypothetical protein
MVAEAVQTFGTAMQRGEVEDLEVHAEVVAGGGPAGSGTGVPRLRPRRRGALRRTCGSQAVQHVGDPFRDDGGGVARCSALQVVSHGLPVVRVLQEVGQPFLQLVLP